MYTCRPLEPDVFQKSWDPEPLKRLVQPPGDISDFFEWHAGHGVQIQYRQVGGIRRVNAGGPGIHRDDVELDEVQDRQE
jgi:hypothetical protein